MRRKILHVVGKMDRGGVETWLMHVMRNIDRDKFELHFMVHVATEGAFDQEIRELGGEIHHVVSPRKLLQYGREFKALVRKHGPFDAIHSHVYWFSGVLLRLAHQAGIPIRIAHSHTAKSAPGWNLPRTLYQKTMRHWIRRYSTHRLGISQPAGELLFGDSGKNAFTLLHYGFDFTRFIDLGPSDETKRSLGIDPARKVVGQVGRFVPVKNHEFTVAVFEKLIASGVNAQLLLVGDGPGLPEIKRRVEALGLAERCTFAGSQPNVAPLFAAMDVLLLPSHWEGLGIVALEAQAAGVPVIASSAVPNEVDVIPHLMKHLALSKGVNGWADALAQQLREASSRGDEAAVLQNSTFGLRKCMDALSTIYLGETMFLGGTN